MSISRITQPLLVLLAVLSAIAICILIRGMMPDAASPGALKVIDADWIPKGEGMRVSEAVYPIKMGYTIHSQLPQGASCCAGTYRISIPQEILKKNLITDRPAIFLPAIGGDFKVALNSKNLNIPKRKDHSSIGPLIPIEVEQIESDLKLEIEVIGSPTPYNGLWKASIFLGDYFTLFNYMEADRFSQIIVPGFNGICMVLFAGLFLFLYHATQKQAKFFLNIGIAFFFYAAFDLFLSGFVRHQNLYLGFVSHYPMRGLVGIGTFLIVTSFLEILSDGRHPVSVWQKKLTFTAIVFLALLNLVLGILGFWTTIVWMVSLSLLVSFWPLFRWPFRKSVTTWYGTLMLVVVLFAFFSTSADSLKLVGRLFQMQTNYGYFTRYTALFLIVSAIFLSAVFFQKIFVTIEKDRVRMMKAQGVSRAIKMLAHDVRKPFSILKLGLNVLEAKPLEAKNEYARRLKVEVSKHIDNVNSMLVDIMDFGGACRLTRSETTVGELVNEVVHESSSLYEQKRIDVKTDFTGDFEVRIDRLKIKRVLQNLLHNAFQATGNDGLVRVGARAVTGEKVLIEIFNSNSFISDDKKKKIFDEFYTSDKES